MLNGYTVVLRTDRGCRLLKLTTSATCPDEAAAKARAAYADVTIAINEQRDLTERGGAARAEPTATVVRRSSAARGLSLSYCLRISGEVRDSGSAHRLTHASAVALLREVVEADSALMKALAGGDIIDLCPAQIWSPRTGWVEIGCLFRARDQSGGTRSVPPASEPLRVAASLIVLRLLLLARETVRQPLDQRWALASHEIVSATARAVRRIQGPQEPRALIAWLRDRGHDALATDIAGGFRR